jgi:hypothetical protein
MAAPVQPDPLAGRHAESTTTARRRPASAASPDCSASCWRAPRRRRSALRRCGARCRLPFVAVACAPGRPSVTRRAGRGYRVTSGGRRGRDVVCTAIADGDAAKAASASRRPSPALSPVAEGEESEGEVSLLASPRRAVDELSSTPAGEPAGSARVVGVRRHTQRTGRGEEATRPSSFPGRRGPRDAAPGLVVGDQHEVHAVELEAWRPTQAASECVARRGRRGRRSRSPGGATVGRA